MPLPNPFLSKSSSREYFGLGREIDTQYTKFVRAASVSKTEDRMADVRIKDLNEKTSQLQTKNSELLDAVYEITIQQNSILRQLIEALSRNSNNDSSRMPRLRSPIRSPLRNIVRRSQANRNPRIRQRLQRTQELQRQRRIDNIRRTIGLAPITRPAADRVRNDSISRQLRVRENTPQTLRSIGRIGSAGLGGVALGAIGGGIFGRIAAGAITRMLPNAYSEEERRKFIQQTTRETALDGAVVGGTAAVTIAVIREIALRIAPRYASRITGTLVPGVGVAIGIYNAISRAGAGDINGALLSSGVAVASAITAISIATGIAPAAAIAGASTIGLQLVEVIRDLKNAVYQSVYNVEPWNDNSPDSAERMQNVDRVVREIVIDMLRVAKEQDEREVERLTQNNLTTLAQQDPEFANTDPTDIERIRILTERLRFRENANKPGLINRPAREAYERKSRELEQHDLRRGRTPIATRSNQISMLNPSELILASFGGGRSPYNLNSDELEFDELIFDAERIIFEGEIASSNDIPATQIANAGIMNASFPVSTIGNTQTFNNNNVQTPSLNGSSSSVMSPTVNTSNAAAGRFFNTLRTQESGTNDTARNPNSSAAGRYQFINSTWLQFARENPSLFAGMDQQQILNARNNPQIQEMAVRWYASRNASQLQRSGVPVNDTTVALAHFLGPGGAVAVLQANPNTPLEQLLPPNVIAANSNVLRGKTAGQLIENYSRRYGNSSSFATSVTPNPTVPTIGQELNSRGTDAEAETQRLRRESITPPQDLIPRQNNLPPSQQTQQSNMLYTSNEVPLRNRLLELASA